MVYTRVHYADTSRTALNPKGLIDMPRQVTLRAGDERGSRVPQHGHAQGSVATPAAPRPGRRHTLREQRRRQRNRALAGHGSGPEIPVALQPAGRDGGTRGIQRSAVQRSVRCSLSGRGPDRRGRFSSANSGDAHLRPLSGAVLRIEPGYPPAVTGRRASRSAESSRPMRRAGLRLNASSESSP